MPALCQFGFALGARPAPLPPRFSIDRSTELALAFSSRGNLIRQLFLHCFELCLQLVVLCSQIEGLLAAVGAARACVLFLSRPEGKENISVVCEGLVLRRPARLVGIASHLQ